MMAALLWLLPLELLGLLAFPVTYRVFSRLPDRGWTLAKPLGLLLLSYVVWLIGLSHTIPNSRWSVLVALLALTGLSVWASRSHWPDLKRFVREHLGTIALSEVLFVGVFALWALYRAYVPDIAHTEQPMDLSLLNSVVVSPHYPPNDPWLSGLPVSYYYFGYLMVGTLTLLTGLATSVAYNLGLATTAALSAVAGFGVVYNLVRLTRGSATVAAVAGLSTAFLLLVASNLEGTLEMMRAAGVGGAGFWERIGVDGLTAPATASSSWAPEGFWWWFRASRVIPGAIAEFPMFSFVLGDMHPHLMSIPFVLLAVALAVQLYLSPGPLGLSWLRENWPLALVLPVAIGALAAINLWDLPLGLALMGGAILLHALRHGHRRSLWWALVLLVAFTAAALVLFFPFYLTFESEASPIPVPVYQWVSRPLHLLIVWGLPGLLALSMLAATAGRMGKGSVERWPQLLVALAMGFAPVALWLQPVWGAIAYGLVVVALVAAVGLGPFTAWLRPVWAGPANLFAAVVPPVKRLVSGANPYRALVLGLMSAVVVVALGWFVADGLSHARGAGPGAVAVSSRMLVVVPLALVVSAAAYGAWSLGHRGGGGASSARLPGGARRDAASPVVAESWAEEGAAPVLGLLAVAAALVMGTELFYVVDRFGRDNTVFKLYYQAWILLALVGGYSIYYVSSRFLYAESRSPRVGGARDWASPTIRIGAGVWGLALVVAVGAVAYYPAAAVYSRAQEGPSNPLTLDGQAFLARSDPAEYQAIRWILSNAPRDAVVVESAWSRCPSGEYRCSDSTSAGRIAASTGRPTVLGWKGHEEQWGRSKSLVAGRQDDVREIYETQDPLRALLLLDKYDADYVVVGHRERGAYGTDGMAKFDLVGRVVFPEGPGDSAVVIYQVDQ